MKLGLPVAVVIGVLLTIAMLVMPDYDRPPLATQQIGYRGLGMEQVTNPRTAQAQVAAIPEPVPPAAAGGPPASAVFKNVQVLGHLSVAEFTRTMVALTNWVSPEAGCNYCHVPTNLASDDIYTKVVSRAMLRMTQEINSQWQRHVGDTGVTCYTCHRGQPVPANLWYGDPVPENTSRFVGNRAGQNRPSETVGLSSLPVDPFGAYLFKDGEIRIVGETALPRNGGASIQATEATYGLMMHMSRALGVNCTYCHNSRSFFDWDASVPPRLPAWHGIRMVRSLNEKYLEPLAQQLPPERLGPAGGAPKLNCATCHAGQAQPLGGVSLLKDHPELAAPGKKP